MILYHNESSHLGSWPRRQLFFCEQPALSGGAAPIVDGSWPPGGGAALPLYCFPGTLGNGSEYAPLLKRR